MIGRVQRFRGDALRLAAVLAGLVLVALLTRPPQSAELDTYSAADTRSGGYAGWAALMQREGVAVERFVQRPADLDGTIDTLIDAYGVAPLAADSRTPADTQALADWVRAGGRLLLIGREPALVARERAQLGRPPVYVTPLAGPPLRARAFGGAVSVIAARGSERFRRRAHAHVLLADRGGALIVRVPLGRGAIVYVVDPSLFANAALARGDDARLAYLLARPRRPGRSIAFDEALHGTIVERGWWATLGVPERITLGGGALALLIALAGGALRLGPPITLRAPREPRADEFIAAVASLYARAGARRAAIALLAAGADRPGEAAQQLRRLRDEPAPGDRDLIRSAGLARTLRGEAR